MHHASVCENVVIGVLVVLCELHVIVRVHVICCSCCSWSHAWSYCSCCCCCRFRRNHIAWNFLFLEVYSLQNRSLIRAPQSSTSQSGKGENDLTNSSCYRSFLLSSNEISRVPHLRIQPCSLETNLAAVRTCFNLDFNHQLVYCCHSH